MKLHLEFDDDLLRKYVDRGSNPLFAIYWSQAGVAYPEQHWLDFGLVVLSWWLVAAKSLLEGESEAEFSFMDGPYSLHVRRFDTLLHISGRGVAWQWQMPIDNFAAELLQAADQVDQKFTALGLADQTGISVGARQLKIALSQVKGSTAARRQLAAAHS